MPLLFFYHRWIVLAVCILSLAMTFSSPTAAEAAPPLSPDMLAIQGRWIRTDAPYMITLSHAQDGSLQAEYFNPRPIHVEKTETAEQGGLLHILIELQDVNYPGSTYMLTYDRSHDILEGVYYQAVQKQSYTVRFVRLSEKQ